MAATVVIVAAGKTLKFLREDYQVLTSTHPAMFLDLFMMCVAQGHKSPSGARYCFPSQTWLGKQSGVCRKTANEAVSFYEKNGFINKQVRRPKKGRFRSLLYFLGPTTLRAMGCAEAAVQALLHRVTSRLHISKKHTLIKKEFKEKSTFNVKINSPPLEEYLQTLGRKLGFVK